MILAAKPPGSRVSASGEDFPQGALEAGDGARWVTAVDGFPTGQYDLTSMVRKIGRVAATEFKAKCLELMDRVAERRESFVITKRGRPVARLVPMDRKPKDSIFGWLRGQAWERSDIVAPATSPDEWTTLKEWDALNATKPAAQRRRRGPGGKRK